MAIISAARHIIEDFKVQVYHLSKEGPKYKSEPLSHSAATSSKDDIEG